MLCDLHSRSILHISSNGIKSTEFHICLFATLCLLVMYWMSPGGLALWYNSCILLMSLSSDSNITVSTQHPPRSPLCSLIYFFSIAFIHPLYLSLARFSRSSFPSAPSQMIRLVSVCTSLSLSSFLPPLPPSLS